MIRIDLVTFGSGMIDSRLELPDIALDGNGVEYQPDLGPNWHPDAMQWPDWLKVRIRHIPDEAAN